MSDTESSRRASFRCGHRGRRGSAAASLLVLCALCLSGTGCVEHALRKEVRQHDYSELPRSEPPGPEDGSVLRGQSATGSLLFLDQKARGVGDLVTVLVVENISAEGFAGTRTGKTSEIDAKMSSDIGITNAVQGAANWFFGLFGLAAAPDIAAGNELNVLDSSTKTDFDGQGETRREGSFRAVVTCRVIEELDGDVFHVKGRRSMIVNHEKQILTVEGLVRRADISINNTVQSNALAEAKLGFDGFGVLDDKQRPALAGRFMDWVYPF